MWWVSHWARSGPGLVGGHRGRPGPSHSSSLSPVRPACFLGRSSCLRHWTRDRRDRLPVWAFPQNLATPGIVQHLLQPVVTVNLHTRAQVPMSPLSPRRHAGTEASPAPSTGPGACLRPACTQGTTVASTHKLSSPGVSQKTRNHLHSYNVVKTYPGLSSPHLATSLRRCIKWNIIFLKRNSGQPLWQRGSPPLINPGAGPVPPCPGLPGPPHAARCPGLGRAEQTGRGQLATRPRSGPRPQGASAKPYLPALRGRGRGGLGAAGRRPRPLCWDPAAAGPSPTSLGIGDREKTAGV